VRLSLLLKDLIAVPADDDGEITGLALDSRLVKPGDLFFAYPGTQVDGRDFIEDAVSKGAVAIVAEAVGASGARPVENLNTRATAGRPYKNISVFSISNLTSQIGIIAARFYGNPSQPMQVIGITGTNGKTSCCHFIAQALHMNGEACGVIGTVGNGLYQNGHQHLQAAELTTPDAITLQTQFAEWRQQQVKFVAMEAASHGLVQGRLNGTQLAIAVFTNLTRDHLDYHGDMESYAQAKRLLFTQPGLRYAVLNVDDEYGRKWAEELKEKLMVFKYSLIADRTEQTISVHHAQFDAIGFTASIHTPWGEGVLHNPFLIGRFNLSNLLAALTVLGILGMPLEIILARLAEVQPVAGRMQTVGGDNKPLAIIDYSHTPDSLEKALQILREQCKGKLWCVFGCGGDRDRGKRPLMGKIAEQYADCVVITDDNPRHENAREIVAEILTGLMDPAGAIIEHDRRRAIEHALNCAQSDDIVLIAGKGHETYQIIGDQKNIFSDVLEAQLVLNNL
jgi:UDP-N-acetylmuramoyl-L-alanyl-D-glutamate--2,6-diaminopimelate ligase